MTTPPATRTRRSIVVPVVVLVVAAVLIVVALATSWDKTTPTAAPTTPGHIAPTEVQNPELPDLTAVEARDPDDLLATGPVDAPVVLVVFSDYQCPFCARWNDQTLPALRKHVDAGDLRIEWRDVNVFGAASERASRAAYAAALQGAFWEFHDTLFPGGDIRSEKELSDDALTALAGELGLDTARFTTDLASAGTAEVIAAHQKLGLDLGATSTPAFIMGGQPIVGAQPTQVFEDAFQTALAAAK